jgi:hypothetical protein
MLACVAAASTLLPTLGLESAQEARAATFDATGFGVAMQGQTCTVQWNGSADHAGQCNAPWDTTYLWQEGNFVAYRSHPYVGGIGSFGMDCRVDFSFVGDVYLTTYDEGNAYWDFQNRGSSIAQNVTDAFVRTGTRLVIVPSGRSPGVAWMTIKKIYNCTKPAIGTDFVIVNPAASTNLQGLACANYAYGSRIDLWKPCDWLGSESLDEVTNLVGLPVGYVAYNIYLPHQSQFGTVGGWASGPNGPVATTEGSYSTWVFAPSEDEGGGQAHTWKIMSSSTGSLTYDRCLTVSKVSITSDITTTGCSNSASQDWMLVPLPSLPRHFPWYI